MRPARSPLLCSPRSPAVPSPRWGSWRRTAATGAGVAAVAGALLAAGAPAASAHDALVSTDPGDGTTVATAPATVHLLFEEPPLEIGARVVVTGPSGVVSTGAPHLHEDTVDQALGGALPAGRYTVDWRVTSDDGHPIDGRTTFTVTASAPPAPTPSAAAPSAPAPSPSAALTDRDAAISPAPWPAWLPWAGAGVAALAASGLLARRRRVAVGAGGAAGAGAREPRA